MRDRVLSSATAGTAGATAATSRSAAASAACRTQRRAGRIYHGSHRRCDVTHWISTAGYEPNESGIAALANSGTVATLLPATLFFLGKTSYAPARRLLDAGARVALATDYNPGTAPSSSMPLVLTMACSQMRMTPLEAITAATAERVAILDVDYHHGNGTQQIFWRRGDVRYVSIHADPARAYPYFLGYPDETGEGEGAGENLNIPLRAGATDHDYLEATDRAVEAIGRAPGSIVVVSLGFDTTGSTRSATSR